ncbi:MAG: HEPN domain-containing protein [archaeon]
MNKAKKEIAEGMSHRGLVKTGPDREEAMKHLKKAQHNYKAVLAFENTGFPDWSVSAVFYTIYHCFLAIIRKFGYESRNQECTIALIENLKEEEKIKMGVEIIESVKNHQ